MHSNVSYRKKIKPTQQGDIIKFFTRIDDDSPVSALPKPIKEESSINFDTIQYDESKADTSTSSTATTSSSSISNHHYRASSSNTPSPSTYPPLDSNSSQTLSCLSSSVSTVSDSRYLSSSPLADPTPQTAPHSTGSESADQCNVLCSTTTQAVPAADAEENPKLDSVIERRPGPGHGIICCTVCVLYPDTVRQHSSNRKVAPITLKEGTQYRTAIINHHLKTEYHLACVDRHKRKAITTPGIAGSATDIEKYISAKNSKKANFIGRCFLSIYTDSKKLTPAAFNWPARMFAAEYGHGQLYNINDPAKNERLVRELNLQYLNPMAHADFLECIVHVESTLIAQKIDECLGLSIRADGSVDRTSIDKIYVLAKIINKEGKLETLFLGIGEQIERGAKGLHACIKSVINKHGADFYTKVLRKISSFVTDGASVNVGEHNGLWRLTDDDAKEAGAAQPIIKIWCAAHRSDLAVKDLNKCVEEVPQLIQKCSSIASFIRRSGIRTALFKQIAKDKGLEKMVLPRYHEVRWSQFTSQLVHAVLVSWRCLVFFFRAMSELNDDHAAESRGYLNFLTTLHNIELLAFLADLFYIHSNFQKKLQSDNLNIILLSRHVSEFRDTIEDLRTVPLMEGWETGLTQSLEHGERDDGVPTISLKGIEIQDPISRRVASTVRDFQYLRNEIINKFSQFIEIRFSSPTENLCDLLMPFLCFNLAMTNFKKVHEVIAKDLDPTSLHLQFKDICRDSVLKTKTPTEILKHLVKNDETQSYTDMITVLARILSATPHSADVERTISANNSLKSPLRSSIKLATENNYLFVHFNLPPVIQWKPEKAIIHWLNTKDRRTHNLMAENEKTKITKRKFFNGIFFQGADDDDDEEEKAKERPAAKKRRF